MREFGTADYNLVFLNQKKQIQKYVRSNTIIAISDAIKRAILNLNQWIRVERVYNGLILPDEYVKEYRKDGILCFCIVGKIQQEKGQMDVLRSVKILLDKGYTNFKILIVGSGDIKYIKMLKQYIVKNNMSEVIQFLGYQEQIQEILPQFDVGIMASSKEAFGRSTIEYMANYMPVIGTNSGGTKELIRQGSEGFLFPAGKYRALADNMQIFLENRSLLAQMGYMARKRALHFSVKKNTSEVYRIYQRIISDAQ